MDLLFSWSAGGNCCAPKYLLLLFLGNATFKVLEHEEFWSWDEPELLASGASFKFRVDSVSAGMGLTESHSSMKIFEIVDSELKLVEAAIGNAYVPAIIEMHATDFDKHSVPKSEKISAHFDFDGDTINDRLECGWWERWGLLTCEVVTSSVGTIGSNLGCPRIGILETATDGMRDLVCGRDLILRYSFERGQYVR